MNSGIPTDSELLGRFGEEASGQEAFAEIVRRHGPMVHQICRRLCRTLQDAEDAAQNVFVALSRRADELQSRTCVAGWLHRTACYTAMRWRRNALTRRHHERQAAELRPESDYGGAGLEAREPIDQLHRALGALPEDYRNALILHHLEGHTVEQIAELLDMPTGTVAARISRGRAMLRQRLTLLGLILADRELDALFSDEISNSPQTVATRLVVKPLPAQRLCPRMESSMICGSSAGTYSAGGGILSAALKLKIALFAVGVSMAAYGYESLEPLDRPPGASPAPKIKIAELFTSSSSSLSGSSGSVPEPSGLLPLALGCTFLTRRRRRAELR